ncbi:unnamed protein product [Adineta ricciae]|uniref:Metalloendopeptidase n=1 Tax=Adineta ricciae TaxID=249248 RepID=A0A815BEX8_ADIRI|nr:unnamed protein product [Adineta ricciae]CAF1266677.1 unnamed protein product [Adineta ricciae]
MPNDTSCVPMDENKNLKKRTLTRFHGLIFLFILVLIPAIVFAVMFGLQMRRNSELSVINTHTTIAIDPKRNITIKGLLTVNTATKAKICNENQTIEDCVLVYNSKIIMNALVLAPSVISERSSKTFSFPENASESTIDCKAMYVRRSQLPDIFEPTTLKTIYELSGVPYTNISRAEQRTQIDARSIQNKWTSPINYYINTASGLTSTMADNIRTAVSNWENNTCLKFNELTTITTTTNKSYISFRRDDTYGCSSPVGYDPTDPTSVILISVYCSTIIASIMHEIGHTLGYIHTQSRIDRDSYVTIVSANIITDYAANFYKWYYGTIRFLDTTFPYDFGSFMHYDAYGFTNNGEATIVPLDVRYARTMGQREKAAFYDYKQMNRLYFNRADCPTMFTNNNCQNNGYLDPKTCSRCVCPEGLSGTYCDQRDTASTCGDTITNSNPSIATQVTIQNPTPTSTTSSLQTCVYLIKSQTAGKIRFRLDALKTVARYVCSLTSVLEVKYQSDLALTGARWCGTAVPTTWLNITAESTTMILIFRSNNYINTTTGTPQAGFRATIFFDAEATSSVSQSVASTTSSIATTTSSTTSMLPSTTTSSSGCSTSSRCQLASQPTCGGCLSYQPCTTDGTQPCTAYNYQISLTGCDQIVNGVAQCRYQFSLVPYTTNCKRTVLLCCPNYQLFSYGTQYYCVYNPQAIDASTWSAYI